MIASKPATEATPERGSRSDCTLSENGLRVLKARYLKKDPSGRVVEAPQDLFERVARTIGDVEKLYGASEQVADEWKTRFFELMWSRRFMPNSPTLMNAGRDMGMLSACFVLPVKDSINDIFVPADRASGRTKSISTRRHAS